LVLNNTAKIQLKNDTKQIFGLFCFVKPILFLFINQLLVNWYCIKMKTNTRWRCDSNPTAYLFSFFFNYCWDQYKKV